MTTDFGRHSALSPAAPVEPVSRLAAARINHGRRADEIMAAEMRRALKFGAFLDSLGGRGE